MQRQENQRLPYVQGGPPGALMVFAIISAAFGIITGISSVNKLYLILKSGYLGLYFQNGYIIEGLWLLGAPVLSVYSVVLAFRLASGACKLRRGTQGGAVQMEAACQGSIVVLWVYVSATLLIDLIALIRASYSGAFLGFILAVALILAVTIPVYFYLKNAKAILNHVGSEDYRGSAMQPYGIGRFTALCVTLASVLFLFLALLMFGAIKVPYSYEIYGIRLNKVLSLLFLVIYYAMARFLLANVCYRGFRRSHEISGDWSKEPPLASARYGTSSSLCVLGSVMFGWQAISEIYTLINNLNYYSSWGIESSYGSTGAYVFNCLLYVAGTLLLGLALTRRRNRKALALPGAACAFISLFWRFIVRIKNGALASSANAVFGTLFICLVMAALVLFAVGLLNRRGGLMLYRPAVILAVAAAFSYLIACIINLVNYRGDLLDYITSFLEMGTYLACLLGLAGALSEPDDEPSGGYAVNDGTAKIG